MKPDIKERIMRDFGPDQTAATALIKSFEAEQKLSPCISRCVVDLAKGDLSSGPAGLWPAGGKGEQGGTVGV